MRITFNKLTALCVLRAWRSSGRVLTANRGRLEAPSVGPRKYWTRRRIAACLESVGVSLSDVHGKAQVMVPRPGARIRSRTARNTVYVRGLPIESTIELVNGICIPRPELLFVEMGTIMSPVVQLLVGLELCGRFSRDARDPRDGNVTYDIKPVTTADKIRLFVSESRSLAGLEQSRMVAEWLMDEAWSPQEALLNAFARMPLHELGYELGELRLNPRVMAGGDAELLVAKRSRVPNTLVVGTSVGFNYHGGPHFGEDFDEDAEPDFQQNGVTAIGPLRAAIVADKHRDRDLLVQGLSVLPVTKEDLLERGGLDCVMLQAMSIIERLGQSDSTRAD